MIEMRQLLIWGTGKDSVLMLHRYPIINIMAEYFVDSHKRHFLFCDREVLLPSEVEWDSSKFVIIATRKYYDEIAKYLSDKGLSEGTDYIGYSEKVWDKWLEALENATISERLCLVQKDVATLSNWIPDLYLKLILKPKKVIEYIYKGQIDLEEAIISAYNEGEIDETNHYSLLLAKRMKWIFENFCTECTYYEKFGLLRINAHIKTKDITKVEVYHGNELLGKLLRNIYVNEEKNGRGSNIWNSVFTKAIKLMSQEQLRLKIFWGVSESQWITVTTKRIEDEKIPYCYRTTIGTKDGLTVNNGKEEAFYDEYVIMPELRKLCIETSSMCNLRCQYCLVGHNYEAIERSLISKQVIDEAIRIINKFPSIQIIQLNALGEPLLYDGFGQLCERIYRETAVRNVTFHTNGMLLNEKIVDKLIEIPLNYKIYFSLDGTSATENDMLRVGSKYEVVKKNIYYLLHKAVYKSNFELAINNLLLAKQTDEITIPEYLLNDFGFITIDSHRTFYFPELSREKLSSDNICVYENQNKKVCKRCFLESTIRHNGDVIRCHWDSKCEEIMGNILKQKFEDIWYGEKYKVMREGMNPNVSIYELPESCQKCHAMNEGYLYRKEEEG
ncbi:MAG: radical SAM/SPASM domain-containing protein [Lachnospiraceae bacterium]|nr:radical SAM/SPASM domain-containing protein [Lachnospiraceae bacterium]